MPKIQINERENQITIWLNTKTYPLEAIYSAAYVFLDRAYIFLDGDPEREIIVSLKGKIKLNKMQLKKLSGEFCNELLNYLLRVEIGKRTQKIREYIVASALVSSLPIQSLTSPYVIPEEMVKEDWKKDPLGITIPWEKKYTKRSKKHR